MAKTTDASSDFVIIIIITPISPSLYQNQNNQQIQHEQFYQKTCLILLLSSNIKKTLHFKQLIIQNLNQNSTFQRMSFVRNIYFMSINRGGKALKNDVVSVSSIVPQYRPDYNRK